MYGYISTVEEFDITKTKNNNKEEKDPDAHIPISSFLCYFSPLSVF